MRSHLKHPYQEEVEVDYWKITVVAFKNAMIKRINKNSYETYCFLCESMRDMTANTWVSGCLKSGWGLACFVKTNRQI